MANALKALLAIVLIIELGFVVAGDAVAWQLYRAVHLLQMLALIAVAGCLAPLGKDRWLILLALASALCGDVINSHLVDLSGVYAKQTLLSIPFFFVTHLLYLWVFWRFLQVRIMPRVFAALILSAILLQKFGPDVNLLAMIAVAVYGATLLTMAVLATSFFARQSPALWVGLGAWIFVVSDCLIAATLFSGAERSTFINAAIWLTYITAQISIASVLLMQTPEKIEEATNS